MRLELEKMKALIGVFGGMARKLAKTGFRFLFSSSNARNNRRERYRARGGI